MYLWLEIRHIGTNFSKFLHIFSRRISHKSFVDLIRICSKVLSSSILMVSRSSGLIASASMTMVSMILGSSLAVVIVVRPCLPELLSFVLCSGQIDLLNSVLRRSPLASIMFHSWFREVVCQYFSWFLLKYLIQSCKEICSSSIFACSFSSNESWLENWSTIEETFFVTCELFPIVWNSDVTQHFRRWQFSTCVSLKARMYNKRIFLWNSCNVIYPIQARELWASIHQERISQSRFHRIHWTAPSTSLASWS